MTMKQILNKVWAIIVYIFTRKGFFTKKLVVATVTLIMMLYVDIKCHVWDGMGLILLVLLTLYVVMNYTMRYIEMRNKEGKNDHDNNDTNLNTEILEIKENDSETSFDDNSGECKTEMNCTEQLNKQNTHDIPDRIISDKKENNENEFETTILGEDETKKEK